MNYDTIREHLRQWVTNWLWRGKPKIAAGACANRRWAKYMEGPNEVTIIYRDTLKPDGYSREELMEMLGLIRYHEAEMGWRTPEPPIVGHEGYNPLTEARRPFTLDEWVTEGQIQLEQYRQQWKNTNDFHRAPHTWNEWWRAFREYVSW